MTTPTDIPCHDWHELHAESPLLAELQDALRAAGFTGPAKITRRRDGYDVSYRIIAGAIDKTVTLHCGHEKAAHGTLAAQIVGLFKQP